MAVISRLPRPIHENYDWQEEGACRKVATGIFFSTDKELPTLRAKREAIAKQVCAGCPVIEACLAHALSAGEAQGIWGGLSERERAALSTAQRESIAG